MELTITRLLNSETIIQLQLLNNPSCMPTNKKYYYYSQNKYKI